MIEVKDPGFMEELSDKKYIVKWEATWCSPCKAIAPLLLDLEKETGFFVYRLDVDDFDLLASKYAIRSLPTTFFMAGEKVVETVVGAVSRAKFAEAAEKLLRAVV